MIKTDAQLERTRAQVQGFKDTLAGLEFPGGTPEEARRAVVESHQAMISKLEAEVAEYLDLKKGIVRLPRIFTPKDLAAHLTRFRIALGVTQEQLAGMVGVTRQTINKHEEQEYQLADVDLVTRVVKALGILPAIAVRHQTLDVRQPNSPGRELQEA